MFLHYLCFPSVESVIYRETSWLWRSSHLFLASFCSSSLIQKYNAKFQHRPIFIFIIILILILILIPSHSLSLSLCSPAPPEIRLRRTPLRPSFGYEGHFFQGSAVSAWLGFACTFLARPFGGLALGVIGDLFGRKARRVTGRVVGPSRVGSYAVGGGGE